MDYYLRKGLRNFFIYFQLSQKSFSFRNQLFLSHLNYLISTPFIIRKHAHFVLYKYNLA